MITRAQSKNMFVFISDGESEYIKVDKRLYFKFIDMLYDGFEEREIFLSTKDSGFNQEKDIVDYDYR